MAGNEFSSYRLTADDYTRLTATITEEKTLPIIDRAAKKQQAKALTMWPL